MAQDVRYGGVQLEQNRDRPRVHVVDGRMFVSDAASAASLLFNHRIWATPVGVRLARNRSPERSFPCVLSQEQATLVLRRNLADVAFAGRDHLDTAQEPEAGVSHLKPSKMLLPSSRGGGGGGGVNAPTTVATATSTEQSTAIHERGRPCRAELDSTMSKVGWTYPSTLVEEKSAAVFEDLWVRGLCVAGGSKYGADYVIYDGPPTQRHSVAAIVVSRGPNDELSPAEVSGFARVQQAVAKKAVIATGPKTSSVASSAGAVLGKPCSTVVYESDRARPRDSGRAKDDDVRYATLQFHSVSNRA